MKRIACYVPQGIDLLFARLARAPEAEVAEQAPGVAMKSRVLTMKSWDLTNEIR